MGGPTSAETGVWTLHRAVYITFPLVFPPTSIPFRAPCSRVRSPRRPLWKQEVIKCQGFALSNNVKNYYTIVNKSQLDCSGCFIPFHGHLFFVLEKVNHQRNHGKGFKWAPLFGAQDTHGRFGTPALRTGRVWLLGRRTAGEHLRGQRQHILRRGMVFSGLRSLHPVWVHRWGLRVCPHRVHLSPGCVHPCQPLPHRLLPQVREDRLWVPRSGVRAGAELPGEAESDGTWWPANMWIGSNGLQWGVGATRSYRLSSVVFCHMESECRHKKSTQYLTQHHWVKRSQEKTE